MADNEAKLVIKAEDQTAGAFRSVETRLSSLDGATAKFGSAMAGLSALGIGAGTAAAALAVLQQKISGAVTEMADLDDAAEKTGASVEGLSSIFNTLKPGGATLNEIVDLSTKLVRAMQGADEETSKAAEAFQKLGIATRDSAGNLRPTDEVLRDLAKSLATYSDGANKTAIAQAILGKSGAEYLPKLKDLANDTQIAGTVTAEMAAKSEELGKTWGRIKVQGEALWISIASQAIPVLNDLLKKFEEAGRAGVGFFDKLQLATMSDSSLPKAIDQQVQALAKLRGSIAAIDSNGELFPGDRAGVEAKIKQRETVLLQLLNRYKELGLAAASAGAVGEKALLYGADAYGPRPDAPALTGVTKPKAMAEDKYRPFEDYQQRIAKDVGKLFDDSALVKAKELADVMKVLDDFYFSGAINADLYESALQKLFKVQSVTGEKGQEANEKLAESYKRLGDPLREHQARLEEIVKLEEMGKLTFEESGLARERVIIDMNKALGETSDKMKEVDDIGKQLGMTFQSAAEDAILEFKSLRDVLQGILKDIARIALREGVTKPFAGMVAGFVNSFMGAQTTTPNANVGYDGYDPVLLGKSVSGPSVTVVNNIDSTTDRAVVAQLVNQATKSAVAQVYDRQSRNDWKAVPA